VRNAGTIIASSISTQGTIGSPARRDAIEFSSEFSPGGSVVAGLPGRTIQDDTSLRLSHSRPGSARAQAASIIWGKTKVTRKR